jgi:hypothetical protein
MTWDDACIDLTKLDKGKTATDYKEPVDELEALRERDELQADCARLGRAVVGYEKRIQELEELVKQAKPYVHGYISDEPKAIEWQERAKAILKESE